MALWDFYRRLIKRKLNDTYVSWVVLTNIIHNLYVLFFRKQWDETCTNGTQFAARGKSRIHDLYDIVGGNFVGIPGRFSIVYWRHLHMKL